MDCPRAKRLTSYILIGVRRKKIHICSDKTLREIIDRIYEELELDRSKYIVKLYYLDKELSLKTLANKKLEDIIRENKWTYDKISIKLELVEQKKERTVKQEPPPGKDVEEEEEEGRGKTRGARGRLVGTGTIKGGVPTPTITVSYGGAPTLVFIILSLLFIISSSLVIYATYPIMGPISIFLPILISIVTGGIATKFRGDIIRGFSIGFLFTIIIGAILIASSLFMA